YSCVSFFIFFFFFFFFSSRRRHTRFSRDWSSDVCSSDLEEVALHVMHADQGTVARVRERFAVHDADQQRAHEARSLRDGDRVDEIGRASCRERVEVWGGAVACKKKKKEGGKTWQRE